MVVRLSLFNVFVLALFAPVIVTGQIEQVNYELRAEQWELARQGERLIKVPVLKDLVRDWGAEDGLKIELQYPGGEEGELWVQELMGWLISLGIPSQYLVAVPGSGAADIIRFQLIKAGDNNR